MDPNDPLVKRKNTINPYHWGASVIAHRLLWDLRQESWRSRAKLKECRNRYADKKAVILCNGPSLNKVDFDLLQNRCFTFGLNKINLLFERTKFRPDCVVAVNPYVIEQNMSFFNETNIPLYLDKEAFLKRWVKPDKNITFLDSTYLSGFAKDCSISINQGNTVTYIAMQLAFHMGFKDVALVGADHNFASSGPANKTVQGGDKDESHFDPSYFAGVKWQLPDLFESEVAYTRAKNMFEAHDRQIYNCTDGGKLEVFDRITLENFIGMK